MGGGGRTTLSNITGTIKLSSEFPGSSKQDLVGEGRIRIPKLPILRFVQGLEIAVLIK